MRWGAANGGAGILATDYGLEFKTSNYNYDDAQNTGKGPAYVTASGGYFRCTAPGCYLDSDFASAKNSVGEYKEPQVAFGIEPGAGKYIAMDYKYEAQLRAVTGRGNKALVKVKQVPTKRVMNNVGAFGVFQCADVPHYDVVKFQDGVYAPTCLIRQVGNNFQVCSEIPEPCQGEFNKAGGGTGYAMRWRLGGVPGPVSWQLQAYTEPDDFYIVKWTGWPAAYWVSVPGAQGYKSGQFNYAPRSDGKVTIGMASTFPGTRWHLIVGCPGYPLDGWVPK